MRQPARAALRLPVMPGPPSASALLSALDVMRESLSAASALLSALDVMRESLSAASALLSALHAIPRPPSAA
jgi:hypothetical protein